MTPSTGPAAQVDKALARTVEHQDRSDMQKRWPTAGSGTHGVAPASVLIRGARLIDGSGAPEHISDVVLANGRVVDIARPARRSSHETALEIDAEGLVLAPGFIDAHSHADSAPLMDESDASKVSQGVTTEVVGNCGFSLAPSPADTRDGIRAMVGRIFPELAFDWSTQEELNVRLDTLGYVVNAVPLVGHHTLRAAAMGFGDCSPTETELEDMKRHLRMGLEAGAFGLSSGLIYPPGMYADVEELTQLASVLEGRHVYATHLRSEGSRLIEGVEEALAVARTSGCRLQISHLKAAGRDAWGRVAEVLALLDEATEQGIVVHHDVYPYDANSTMLVSCLPPWMQDGGYDDTIRRLHDPSALARAEREVADNVGGWDNWVAGSGWSRIRVAATATHRHEGLTMVDAAAERGETEFASLVGILLENDLRATMNVFAMREDDVRLALRHPRAMIGSDGLPPGNGGKPHPRLFGTFSRVLGHYVRDVGLFTLPEAIARMTSLPARTFGLTDRGLLRPGAAADVVLLDPDRVADRATFLEPTQLSEGIELVFVNGHVAYEDQKVVQRAGTRLEPHLPVAHAPDSRRPGSQSMSQRKPT